ncbi:MAG: hypothetical protein AAFX76_05995, partial [Planctomycetota bacterium]
MDEPWVLQRLCVRYGLVQRAGAGGAEVLGRFAEKYARLERETEPARGWLVKVLGDEALGERRPGDAARVEMLFGDPPGAMNRLDDWFEELEARDPPGDPTLRDRLTFLRAMRWGTIVVAGDDDADGGPDSDSGDLSYSEHAWRIELEAAVEAVREAGAAGLLGVSRDAEAWRAGVLILIEAGEWEEGEALWSDAGDAALARGMGYVGWWLVCRMQHAEEAVRRLTAALDEDRQLTKRQEVGYLPVFPPEALGDFDDPKNRARLMHELERNDLAWVLDEALASEDLGALVDADEGLAAWVARVHGDIEVAGGTNAYARVMQTWALEGEALARVERMQAQAGEEQARALRRDLEADWTRLGLRDVDGWSPEALAEHLGAEVLKRNMADYQAKEGGDMAGVLRLMLMEKRLTPFHAFRLASYYGWFHRADTRQKMVGERLGVVSGTVTMGVVWGVMATFVSWASLPTLCLSLSSPTVGLIVSKRCQAWFEGSQRPPTY